MALKRTGFKTKTLDEVKQKQAIKRAKKLTEPQSSFDKVRKRHDRAFGNALKKRDKECLDEMKRATRTPLKRSKLAPKAVKPRKTLKSTRAKKMGQKKALCEKYGLPIIPCSRWGTAKRPTDTDLLRGMLWTVFSKYIRKRDADKPCISCGKTVEVKQAGHYLPVGNSSVGTWFDEMNVSGECEPCNGFDTFHLVPMRKNLIKIYGEKAIEQLEARKNQAVKLDEIFYVDKIKYYQGLLVE